MGPYDGFILANGTWAVRVSTTLSVGRPTELDV